MEIPGQSHRETGRDAPAGGMPLATGGSAAHSRAFMGGAIADTARWLTGPARRFDPAAPPRARRRLDAPAPEIHEIVASDGVPLRLTRFPGGARGPVLVVHCIGVSSRMYTTDTISPNLVETLVADGFDVWLLDFRFSIELRASLRQSTFDDVALRDYPAAVAAVRALTGAATVQVVAHGVGSSTFTMAMLAGLEGVRAAVCSQVSTHLVVPRLNEIKTQFRTPTLMWLTGARTTTCYVDSTAGWGSRAYDRALRLYPIAPSQRCDSPICHRITTLYGELFRHERLAPATHEALHELFGVVNFTALRQLSRITRAGHLVDARGDETYLGHLDRLALPIAFIHGALNECVLPVSTEITLDLLQNRNGSDLYRRHLIPGYGHVDCMFGEHAGTDVFPRVLEHLRATA